MKNSVNLREKKLKKKIHYYLDIYVNGVRSYEFLPVFVNESDSKSEKIEKKRDAEFYLNKKKTEVEQLSVNNIVQTRWTINQTIQNYMDEFVNMSKSTIYCYKSVLSNITKLGMDIEVRKINADWFIKFQNQLKNNGLSNNSILRYLRNINAVLNYNVKKGNLNTNPYNYLLQQNKLKPVDTELKFLDSQELDRFIKYTKTQDFEKLKYPDKITIYSFMFSLYTGLRCSDILKLRYEDFTCQMGKDYILKIVQKKTGKIVNIPLNQQAINIFHIVWVMNIEKNNNIQKTELTDIDEKFEYYKGLYYTTNYKGVISKNKSIENNSLYQFLDEPLFNIQYYNLRKHLHKIADKLQIDGLNAHWGRHTFATQLYKNGVDLYTISKLLGHTKITTTQVYADVLNKQKIDAVNKLNF